MDRSGAGGGAYLLHSNVSIRSGKRKHLLYIAKLASDSTWIQKRRRAERKQQIVADAQGECSIQEG